MACDNFIVSIGEVATIFDGPHATPSLVDEGPVFLGIDSLDNGRLDLTKTRHVSERDFKQWTRRVEPKPGDLVFSYETRIGQAALIPEGLRCCLGRRLALVRPNTDKISSLYLLYYFLSPVFQEVIRSRTIHGSTVDRIHLKEFPSFSINLPSISEQSRITEVLCALDDKIDLNGRLTTTLEAITQTLFKSWFVDFDPVRSKLGGSQLNLPSDIGDVFPDGFGVDDLPEGWRRGSLLDHAHLVSGGTPNTTEAAYWDGNILWASAKDVSQNPGRFLISTERKITMKGLEESATRLVPKFSTVVVARGATTGRHCLFGKEMAMNQTCYALRSLNNAPFWLTCTFTHIVNDLLQSAHGSVFDTLTTTTFRAVRVTTPSANVVRIFEQIVEPIYQRILSIIEENATLMEMRDALLPKLISGELRIQDAERTVGEAA